MARDFEKYPVPALTRLAERIGRTPVATVYLSRSRSSILVVSMTTPTGGMYVEAKPVIMLSWDTATDILGQWVWEALLRFRKDPNLGPGKKTEWPAYQASGSKSVRAFEEDFVRFTVEAFPAVLRIEASVPVKAAEDLFVGRYITNACDFTELGDLIHLIYRCTLHIEQAEFS